METIKEMGNWQMEPGKSLVIIYNEMGRILKYVIPNFKGVKVFIENAYTAEEWAKHGSDKQNYQWQIAEGFRRVAKLIRNDPELSKQYLEEDLSLMEKGIKPEKYTMHHAYTSNDGKDLVMQLVESTEHGKPHIGASKMANPSKRVKDIENAGNWNISKVEQLLNHLDYYAHKHHGVVAASVGAGAAGVVYLSTKKWNPKLRIGISLFAGVVAGLFTNSALTRNAENHIYG